MKKLDKLLQNRHYIAFLDFEGTQFSHEMIALGGVLCSLNKEGKIKKMKKPIKLYVKAKNPIGNYVVTLTGITQYVLDVKGISFKKAMEELKKYLGLHFKKCVFMTYGNHDMRILGQSIAHNLDFPKEICQQIQRNYIDFSAFVGEFIRDEKGNPLSLIHNCELFNVEQAGTAHDPSVDAINLANLYNAFLSNPELVAEEYEKSLFRTAKMPTPIVHFLKRVEKGDQVNRNDLRKDIEDYLA